MRQSADVVHAASSAAVSVQAPALRLAHAMQRRLVGFIAWRAMKAAEAELATLDDRMLKDIGLTRSEIGSVLWAGGRDRQPRCE